MVEGAPHTAKRSKGSIVVVSRGAPCPRIERIKGEGAAGQAEARQGGVLLLPGVGFPPPLPSSRSRSQGKEREEKEGGGAAPPPSPIRARPWGRAASPLSFP